MRAHSYGQLGSMVAPKYLPAAVPRLYYSSACSLLISIQLSDHNVFQTWQHHSYLLAGIWWDPEAVEFNPSWSTYVNVFQLHIIFALAVYEWGSDLCDSADLTASSNRDELPIRNPFPG